MADIAAAPLTSASPPHGALARAERFVWRTARVLEQRLFAHHFREGAAAPVETALEAYRNDDGGYGHALEPGLRGPASLPEHTARALRVLDAVGRCDARRAEDVCRYLTSVSTAEGALPAVRPVGNGRGTAGVPDAPGSLSATGPVVGLLHRNGVWHAWLFRATHFCWQAVESLERPRPYEVEAAVLFLDHAPDRARAEAAARRLGRLVRGEGPAVFDPDGLDTDPPACALDAGTRHPAAAGPGAPRLPHDYAPTPDSLARAWFTDAEMARSLDVLAAGMREDGGWPVRHPAHTPERTPLALLEARPMATIDALRTLAAYGRPIT
ncbi:MULTISPECIES: hypothetical protein [unclassified Streptomyces]|uniref:hypothetical protein n=1 Tax=unclassified Streptomyces TaxID=2593676 RepID=UPI001E5C7E28|nr:MULTISPECIES: hypothetical protein [unclassified Streptomyces]MDU0303419.1 hypothetical protein [Streptomyces sp. PAL114]